jgi:hypothetical protein
VGSPLVRWLATLDGDGLAEILLRRPETLAAPCPGSLTGLAARLQERRHAIAALRELPLPAVQLVEVIQACGTPAAPLERVAAALGRPPGDPDLDATLCVLAKRALVWSDGDELRMAGPLWTVFDHPLGLGAPAARLLDRVPMSDLRRVADALGVPPGQGRSATARAVADELSDEDVVTRLARNAPAATRALLSHAAARGPLVLAPLRYAGGPRDLPEGAAWAAERGLLLPDGWEHLHLPGEVGRTLRGDRSAPFDPRPPHLPTAAVPPAEVAGEAAAAAAAGIGTLTALLRECAGAPVALRKAGGVGVREVRRLARAVGCDEAEVRLWLELAYEAELLGTLDGQVLPTEAYDSWAAADPARRLAPVLDAWLTLRECPMAETDGEGGASGRASLAGAAGLTRPLLAPGVPMLAGGTAPAAPRLRAGLLRVLAELPSGSGMTCPEPVADTLWWRAPLAVGDRAAAGRSVAGAWREAHLLGVLAHGALSPLGRALLDGDAGEAVAALLPAPARRAVFQADLTAVVSGLPDPALAELLDAAGDRESRGAATTWRFGAASLRRALDAGHTPDGLLAALRAVAAGDVLPQALEYTVADLARRHGTLRVRAARCVISAADPTLVTEVCGVRALRQLGLSRLAPTVLASARPPAETLAALRAAGYAPVGEDAAGAPVIERVEPLRAPPSGSSMTPPRDRGGRVADARALARALASAARAADVADRPLEVLIYEPDEPEPGDDLTRALAAVIPLRRGGVPPAPAPPPGVGEFVDLYARHLGDGQRRLLADAIEMGSQVTIDYIDSGGYSSTRVIEPLELDRHLLTAWCHLRSDERVFALDRIETVRV